MQIRKPVITEPNVMYNYEMTCEHYVYYSDKKYWATTHYNYRACSAMKPPAHSFCAVNARGGLELVVESVDHCCLSYTVHPALSDPHSLHGEFNYL